MAGEHDPRVQVQEVRAIRDALAGPSRLVVLPGAGHVSLLHADQDLWRSEITAALSEQPGRQ